MSPQLRKWQAKPWRAKDASPRTYTFGMLGVEERKVLYHVAKDILSGEGDIVDVGAFCGASASCFAEGLRHNKFAQATKIHSYDRFVANSQFYVDFIATHSNYRISLGESFEPIFREVTAPYADLIEIHSGDLLQQEYDGSRPIECLFINAAKSIELNGQIVKIFFPHLIPKKSIIIQQDFFYPSTYWVIVTMWRLRDFITLIEPRRDWTAVFLLEKAIPEDVVAEISNYPYDFDTQKTAIQWMMTQMPDDWEYLAPSMAKLIYDNLGVNALNKCLEQELKTPRYLDSAIWDAQIECIDSLRGIFRYVSNPNQPTFVFDELSLHWQMTRWEKYAFDSLLRFIKPEVAIEIGTYKGGSLQVISKFAKKTYSVDISSDARDSLKDKFPNVEFVVGDSKVLLAELLRTIYNKDELLGFILVDGDHSTDGVRTDINTILENYQPVRPLYLLMHDAFNPDCREGILSANWAGCKYCHFIEVDFVPGVYHFEAFDTAEARSMWGGYALALLLPNPRCGELTVYQSQKGTFEAVYLSSCHSMKSAVESGISNGTANMHLQDELNNLRQQIKVMESSKFWKLRNFWFRIRNMIRRMKRG